MYSLVLLTALTAGGEAEGLGCGGGRGWFWHGPLPYVDVAHPVPIGCIPHSARFGPGGSVGPSLAVALRGIVPGGTPLSAAEKQAWADYYKELSFEEQAEVAPMWRSADLAGQRRLLARIAAMRPKDKGKGPDKDE